jgi:hypothetical protein
MAIQVVQLGDPRATGEGLRLGASRAFDPCRAPEAYWWEFPRLVPQGRGRIQAGLPLAAHAVMEATSRRR